MQSCLNIGYAPFEASHAPFEASHALLQAIEAAIDSCAEVLDGSENIVSLSQGWEVGAFPELLGRVTKAFRGEIEIRLRSCDLSSDIHFLRVSDL